MESVVKSTMLLFDEFTVLSRVEVIELHQGKNDVDVEGLGEGRMKGLIVSLV